MNREERLAALDDIRKELREIEAETSLWDKELTKDALEHAAYLIYKQSKVMLKLIQLLSETLADDGGK